jgi:hypothetical protein
MGCRGEAPRILDWDEWSVLAAVPPTEKASDTHRIGVEPSAESV